MSRRKGKRITCTATVYPIGHRPMRDRAQLSYCSEGELADQLGKFARFKWPEARRIDVDVMTRTILVNGSPLAKYVLNPPRESADQPDLLGAGA